MKPRCPICRKELPQAKSPFRPFCSERCQMIDLDNWLAGRYRIASIRMTAPEESQAENDARSASGTDAE